MSLVKKYLKTNLAAVILLRNVELRARSDGSDGCAKDWNFHEFSQPKQLRSQQWVGSNIWG